MQLDAAFLTDWGSAAIRLATPLGLAVVGGVYAERSGVFNIGIEGMMLSGAFVSVAVSFFLGSADPAVASLMAAIAAMIAGGGMAFIHAYLSITRRADQIISGAAINILALGLTNTLYRAVWGTEGRERVAGFPTVRVPVLADIPMIGPILFDHSVIVYVGYVLPFIAAFVLYRTSWGLNIRAAGDVPLAVDTAGLSVTRTRYAAVIFSGAMAGLGGAALALGAVRYFTPGMTAGRGFIVLGAIVFGRWNPILASLACLLFGAADAFQLRAQALELGIPYQFFVMLPYILAVLAIAGAIGRTTPPLTLGRPYRREEG
jgi:general nucleoside transport system permease protein